MSEPQSISEILPGVVRDIMIKALRQYRGINEMSDEELKQYETINELIGRKLKECEHQLDVELGLMKAMFPSSTPFELAKGEFLEIYDGIPYDLMLEEDREEYLDRYERVGGNIVI